MLAEAFSAMPAAAENAGVSRLPSETKLGAGHPALGRSVVQDGCHVSYSWARRASCVAEPGKLLEAVRRSREARSPGLHRSGGRAQCRAGPVLRQDASRLNSPHRGHFPEAPGGSC